MWAVSPGVNDIRPPIAEPEWIAVMLPALKVLAAISEAYMGIRAIGHLAHLTTSLNRRRASVP
jgi:hypothetical protein